MVTLYPLSTRQIEKEIHDLYFDALLERNMTIAEFITGYDFFSLKNYVNIIAIF